MPNRSIVSRLFDAIVDIVKGIREVIVAMIFGKDAMEVKTPSDDSDLFETTDDTKNKTTLTKTGSVKSKQKDKEKKDKRKNKTNGLDGRIKSEGNLDVADDTASTPHKISFEEANKMMDSPIGSKSQPISTMEYEEFKTALSNELMSEYLMNPSNGEIEIGGRYFKYTPDNERIVDGSSIRDIVVTDNQSGTRICSMKVSHYMDENHEYKNDYQINEFDITDMSMFQTQQITASRDDEPQPSEEKDTSKAEMGNETIISDDIAIEEHEEILDEDKQTLDPMPKPKDYKEFMQSIKDHFDAAEIYMRNGNIYCKKNPSTINPELADSEYTSFKIDSTGIIYAIHGKDEIPVKPQFLSLQDRQQLESYVKENISDVIKDNEYKIYETLSVTDKKSGNIGDVHYKQNGSWFELTNARNGQQIGRYENGSIRFTVDAKSVDEAIMITDCTEKMSIDEVVKLAQSGDIEAFNVAIQNFSEEEKAGLAGEIDVMYYFVSRVDRENFDMALTVLNEKEAER